MLFHSQWYCARRGRTIGFECAHRTRFEYDAIATALIFKIAPESRQNRQMFSLSSAGQREVLDCLEPIYWSTITRRKHVRRPHVTRASRCATRNRSPCCSTCFFVSISYRGTRSRGSSISPFPLGGKGLHAKRTQLPKRSRRDIAISNKDAFKLTMTD